MVSKLEALVAEDQILTWLIIAFLVGYFIYKEYPELKRRITSGVVKEQDRDNTDKDLTDRMKDVETRIKTIEDKLGNDFREINSIKREASNMRAMVEESLEEREIIMRALLGALGGLQELGANGPTKKAKAEIEDYLNTKAHKGRSDVLENNP